MLRIGSSFLRRHMSTYSRCLYLNGRKAAAYLLRGDIPAADMDSRAGAAQDIGNKFSHSIHSLLPVLSAKGGIAYVMFYGLPASAPGFLPDLCPGVL